MELRGAAPTPAAPHLSERRSPTGAPPTHVRLRAFDIQLYRACDELTQWLIYAMVVFSPWAFGTTQPWSIWTMTVAGDVLGLLLLVKGSIRWLRGYHPSRWGGLSLGANWLTAVLGFLTVAILGYTLLSAINARATATFNGSTFTFEYRDCIGWLPHSLDRGATWMAFWNYLGLAFSFWAVRDWILGKSDEEQRAGAQPGPSSAGADQPFPARLRNLLWLLAINGAILGLESIAQRLADSPRLLFLVQPRIHKTAEAQFGPWAYRSNAAQYFNLLWPVGLGIWWTLNRAAAGRKRHLLLTAGVIMAACPIISTSRAGALVAVVMAFAGALVLSATHWLFPARPAENPRARLLTLPALGLFLTATLALGLLLGWRALAPRLNQLDDGFANRQLMYDAARPMAADYPLFGTGPGTFETVSYLYPRPDIYWPPQLHNDWLETRITFGWVGTGLIALALLLVVARWFARGGIHGGRRFIVLIWLSLAGCLAHARYDFPFQVYSVLFLFLLLCAVLATLSRRQ